ncbi:hypothetical protein [Halovivax limisalsi]|uniref:hypothetical protein n=1 Tax=Halovivax limisalsi TaxID=1453760 RepID=UPI001FFD5612|nr:hypothetical protein [Halovivax limisalsi]
MSIDTIPQYDGVGVWGGGVIAGIVAGIAMGVILHVGADLIAVFAGLAPVPLDSIGLGWLMHLLVSLGFGLLFAGLLSRRPVRRNVTAFVDFAIVGLVYGAFIGIVAGGLVFPIAMERAGVASLPLSLVPISGAAGEFVAAVIFAIGHLVYGLVLGATFATVNGVVPARVRNRLPAFGS